MAEVVDSIIAELIVKNEAYVRGFNEARAAHAGFLKDMDRLKSNTFDLQAEGQKYKAGADRIAQSEEQLTQKVTRTRKARADAVKQSGNAEVQAEIATQQRITKAVEDGIAARSAAVRKGSGTRIGATVSGRADNARQGLNTGVPGATAEVAAEKEVNSLKIEQIQLEDSLTYLTGKRRTEVAELLAEMRLSNRLEAEGVAESEIALRLEQRRLAVAAERAVATKAGRGGGLGGANEFALQASGGRFGYSFSAGALAGLGVAAGAAITVEAVEQATKYADALDKVSKNAGLSAEALQVYHKAAEDIGQSSDDVDSAVKDLAKQLADAQTGSKDAQKAFAALGITLKSSDTVGTVLPQIIESLSQVRDKGERAAVEMKLFGQAGADLDQMLAGGNDKIINLAKGMEQTGRVLSAQDIAKLQQLSEKLADVKSQLMVDMSHVVANNAGAIERLADAFSAVAEQAFKATDAMAKFATSQGGSRAFLAAPYQTGLAGLAGYAKGYVLRQLGYKPSQAGPSDDDKEATIDRLTAGAPSVADQLASIRKVTPNEALIKQLNAGAPPYGRKGKQGPDLERQEEQRQKFVNDTLARFDDQILSAREQTTADEDEKAAFAREQLQNERQKTLDDVITNAQLHKLKTQQVDKLRAALADTSPGADTRLDNLINGLPSGDFKSVLQRGNQAFKSRAGAINYQAEDRDHQESVQLQQQQLGLERDILQSRIGLAKTAADRRKLELQLLDNQEQQEKIQDAPILKDTDHKYYTKEQYDEAVARRDTAGQRHDLAVQNINQQDADPWQDYLNKLPRSAEQIKEQFEQAAVSGVERLNDSLDNSIAKMLHLHGVAGEFLKDLIQIGLHALEGQLFGSGSGSAAGGSGVSTGGGFLKTAVSAVGAFFGGGKAVGGPVDPGMTYLVGEKGPELLRMGSMGGTIVPNHAITAVNPNARVSSPAPQITVLAPRHYDLSNSLIDRDTLAQMNAENRDYADQISQARAGQAVQVAGSRAPGIVRKTQTLKG